MSYSPRPELYDLEYSFKDYATEAETIERIVRECSPGAKTLLDVACGTGKHLEHLQARFTCEGVDLDEGLLEVARGRIPGVPLHHGDMRSFDLGRRFDVVTCLFSAIGFVGGVEGLERAAQALSRHLESNGVLLVEPWIEPDKWRAGRPHVLTAGDDDLALARVTATSLRDERISITEMHYLVAPAAGDVEHFVVTHEPYLFTAGEMRAAFEGAGLAVEHDPVGLIGRGLWICTPLLP
jgi:SAM-dependent methyltransferase